MLQAEIKGEIYDLQLIADAIKNAEEDVELTINSPGGSALEGMSVARAIMGNPNIKVTAKIENMAASAAAVIALSCDKVEITKFDIMVLHHCWTIAMGNKEELQQEIDAMQHIDEILEEYLTKHCSEENAEMLKEKMADGDVYLNGTQVAEMFDNAELVEMPEKEKQDCVNLAKLVDIANQYSALATENEALVAKVAGLEKQIKDLSYSVPADVQAIIDEVL